MNETNAEARMAINLDEDIGNADWTKQSWDMLGVEDEEDLMEHLDKIGMDLEQFKQLPVYRRNVREIPWLADL